MNINLFCFLFSLIFLQFFSGAIYAQNENSISVTTRERNYFELQKAEAGTYQIIYKNKAHAEAISAEILYRVERERDEKEIKYLIINEFVKIKILPKSVISYKGFAPLEEFVILE